MNILGQIIEHKRKEVDASRNLVPVKILEQATLFLRPTVSLKESIRDNRKSGIIAEFKRRSPSKGVINSNAMPEEITRAYVEAGASALSVLTDQKFFGGSNDDLSLARKVNPCPILRKDFTIDEYQIVEAKAIGADAILLIAAVLSPAESKRLASLARSLSLEVLLEVHNEQELHENLSVGADLIGVNNRNLKDFTVSTDVSKKLSQLMPDGVVKISESGISNPAAIVDLRAYGFEGFLIGENFMKQPDPGRAAANFIHSLNELQSNLKAGT
jgi:indole-3-glycerol phosphate synthase